MAAFPVYEVARRSSEECGQRVCMAARDDYFGSMHMESYEMCRECKKGLGDIYIVNVCGLATVMDGDGRMNDGLLAKRKMTE